MKPKQPKVRKRVDNLSAIQYDLRHSNDFMLQESRSFCDWNKYFPDYNEGSFTFHNKP